MKKQMKWMIAAIRPLVLTMAFCGTSMSAQAQNDDIKHEIGISYGGPATTYWARIGTAIGTALYGAKYENTSYFGSLSAEYFYHPEPSVGIGGILCYSQDNDDINYAGSIGDRTTRYFTVMPAIKWEYLRRDYFGMYLKAAAGYTLQRINETYKGQDESTTDGIFNVQFSLLGMEAGSQHIRAFIELGFGEQGIALAGLRYKF
ncbi:MAG: hypothetical protein IJT75_07640 [Bacteroidaceae bacterium]|nr:hypothetical protein [Bacteroidaceae bacterium]